MKYKFAYVHDKCGNVAFHMREIPEPGAAIDLKSVRLLTRKHPKASEPCVCGVCGEPVGQIDPDCLIERRGQPRKGKK